MNIFAKTQQLENIIISDKNMRKFTFFIRMSVHLFYESTRKNLYNGGLKYDVVLTYCILTKKKRVNE